MTHPKTFIFVCEHGAAKSVIAAAYFNKLASEKNLAVRAIARGTNPDAELSPNTIAGLQADDLTPTESVPQKISPADVESAERIVTFCELPEEFQGRVGIERWDGVPPVSADYEQARDVIVERIHRLINEIS